MVWVMDTSAPPQVRQDQLKGGIRQGESSRTFTEGIMGENRHRHYAEHLGKGKNPRANVVIAMDVVIGSAV